MDSATLIAAIRDIGSAKEVARVVGCSEATAARYRRGETMPNPFALARLMARSRQVAQVMLRLAGLDDLSMDIEEARLWRELHQLQAKRAESPDVEPDPALGAAARQDVGARGVLANARDALSDCAIRRMEAALLDAQRRSRR